MSFYQRNCGHSWDITRDEWEALAEVEAVLHIVKKFTTIVQTEKHFMAGLGHYVRDNLFEQLRAPTISVVDLDNITAASEVPCTQRSSWKT